MGGVGAAHHPLAALLVPQPDLAGPGARLDLIQRPAPTAAGTPGRARPGAEALAEVVGADRPRQPAQRPLIAHHHLAHRPFVHHGVTTQRPDPIPMPRQSSPMTPKEPEPPTGSGGIGREARWRPHRWRPLSLVTGGSGASARRLSLAWSQVGGLRSLLSLLDVELDGLALLQGLQPAGLYRAEMDEYILALLGADEAVALVGVEPLDGATCHDRLPPSRRQAPSMVRRRTGTPQPAPCPPVLPCSHWPVRHHLPHGWPVQQPQGPTGHRLRQVR
jgi:hypothetical protein